MLGKRLIDCIKSGIDLHADRYPPGQHPPAEPVDHNSCELTPRWRCSDAGESEYCDHGNECCIFLCITERLQARSLFGNNLMSLENNSSPRIYLNDGTTNANLPGCTIVYPLRELTPLIALQQTYDLEHLLHWA
jgi:hypothetical protein